MEDEQWEYYVDPSSFGRVRIENRWTHDNDQRTPLSSHGPGLSMSDIPSTSQSPSRSAPILHADHAYGENNSETLNTALSREAGAHRRYVQRGEMLNELEGLTQVDRLYTTLGAWRGHVLESHVSRYRKSCALRMGERARKERQLAAVHNWKSWCHRNEHGERQRYIQTRVVAAFMSKREAILMHRAITVWMATVIYERNLRANFRKIFVSYVWRSTLRVYTAWLQVARRRRLLRVRGHMLAMKTMVNRQLEAFHVMLGFSVERRARRQLLSNRVERILLARSKRYRVLASFNHWIMVTKQRLRINYSLMTCGMMLRIEVVRTYYCWWRVALMRRMRCRVQYRMHQTGMVRSRQMEALQCWVNAIVDDRCQERIAMLCTDVMEHRKRQSLEDAFEIWGLNVVVARRESVAILRSSMRASWRKWQGVLSTRRYENSAQKRSQTHHDRFTCRRSLRLWLKNTEVRKTERKVWAKYHKRVSIQTSLIVLQRWLVTGRKQAQIRHTDRVACRRYVRSSFFVWHSMWSSRKLLQRIAKRVSLLSRVWARKHTLARWRVVLIESRRNRWNARRIMRFQEAQWMQRWKASLSWRRMHELGWCHNRYTCRKRMLHGIMKKWRLKTFKRQSNRRQRMMVNCHNEWRAFGEVFEHWKYITITNIRRSAEVLRLILLSGRRKSLTFLKTWYCIVIFRKQIRSRYRRCIMRSRMHYAMRGLRAFHWTLARKHADMDAVRTYAIFMMALRRYNYMIKDTFQYWRHDVAGFKRHRRSMLAFKAQRVYQNGCMRRLLAAFTTWSFIRLANSRLVHVHAFLELHRRSMRHRHNKLVMGFQNWLSYIDRCSWREILSRKHRKRQILTLLRGSMSIWMNESKRLRDRKLRHMHASTMLKKRLLNNRFTKFCAMVRLSRRIDLLKGRLDRRAGRLSMLRSYRKWTSYVCEKEDSAHIALRILRSSKNRQLESATTFWKQIVACRLHVRKVLAFIGQERMRHALRSWKEHTRNYLRALHSFVRKYATIYILERNRRFSWWKNLTVYSSYMNTRLGTRGGRSLLRERLYCFRNAALYRINARRKKYSLWLRVALRLRMFHMQKGFSHWKTVTSATYRAGKLVQSALARTSTMYLRSCFLEWKTTSLVSYACRVRIAQVLCRQSRAQQGRAFRWWIFSVNFKKRARRIGLFGLFRHRERMVTETFNYLKMRTAMYKTLMRMVHRSWFASFLFAFKQWKSVVESVLHFRFLGMKAVGRLQHSRVSKGLQKWISVVVARKRGRNAIEYLGYRSDSYKLAKTFACWVKMLQKKKGWYVRMLSASSRLHRFRQQLWLSQYRRKVETRAKNQGLIEKAGYRLVSMSLVVCIRKWRAHVEMLHMMDYQLSRARGVTRSKVVSVFFAIWKLNNSDANKKRKIVDRIRKSREARLAICTINHWKLIVQNMSHFARRLYIAHTGTFFGKWKVVSYERKRKLKCAFLLVQKTVVRALREATLLWYWKTKTNKDLYRSACKSLNRIAQARIRYVFVVWKDFACLNVVDRHFKKKLSRKLTHILLREMFRQWQYRCEKARSLERSAKYALARIHLLYIRPYLDAWKVLSHRRGRQWTKCEQAVIRLRMLQCARAFSTWRQFIEWKKWSLSVISHSLVRIMHGKTFEAFRDWSIHTSLCSRLRRLEWQASRGRTDVAYGIWVVYLHKRRQFWDKLGRGVAKMRRNNELRALNAWQRMVEKKKYTRCVMLRFVLRARNLRLWESINQWIDSVKDSRTENRLACEKHSKFLDCRVIRFLAMWRTRADRRVYNRASIVRALSRMMNAREKTFFLRWQLYTSVRQESRTRLGVISRSTYAKAEADVWSQWRHHTRMRRFLRAKHIFFENTRKKNGYAWVFNHWVGIHIMVRQITHRHSVMRVRSTLHIWRRKCTMRKWVQRGLMKFLHQSTIPPLSKYFKFWAARASFLGYQHRQLGKAVYRLHFTKKYVNFNKLKSWRTQMQAGAQRKVLRYSFSKWNAYHLDLDQISHTKALCTLMVSHLRLRSGLAQWRSFLASVRGTKEILSWRIMRLHLHEIAHYLSLWKVLMARKRDLWHIKEWSSTKSKRSAWKMWGAFVQYSHMIQDRNFNMSARVAWRNKRRAVIRWQSIFALEKKKWVEYARILVRKNHREVRAILLQWRARSSQMRARSVMMSRCAKRLQYKQMKIAFGYLHDWRVSERLNFVKRNRAAHVIRKTGMIKAFNRWNECAWLRMKNRMIVKAFLNRWSYVQITKGMNHWRSVHPSVRRENALARGSLMRWTKSGMSRVFNMWEERTKTRRRNRQLLKKFFQKDSRVEESRGFNKWCQVTKMRSRGKRILTTIASKWIHRRVFRAYMRWLSSSSTVNRKKHMLHGAIRKLQVHGLWVSYNTWKNQVRIVKVKGQVVARMSRFDVYSAFRTWCQRVRHRFINTEKIWHAVTVWRSRRGVAKGWRTLVHNTQQRRENFRTLRRSVQRMPGSAIRPMRQAFDVWVHKIHALTRKLRLLDISVSRWIRPAECMVLDCWRSKSLRRQANREVIRRIIQVWRPFGQLSSVKGSWNQWRDIQVRRKPLRAVAMRFRLPRCSMAMNQWRNAAHSMQCARSICTRTVLIWQSATASVTTLMTPGPRRVAHSAKRQLLYAGSKMFYSWDYFARSKIRKRKQALIVAQRWQANHVWRAWNSWISRANARQTQWRVLHWAAARWYRKNLVWSINKWIWSCAKLRSVRRALARWTNRSVSAAFFALKDHRCSRVVARSTLYSTILSWRQHRVKRAWRKWKEMTAAGIQKLLLWTHQVDTMIWWQTLTSFGIWKTTSKIRAQNLRCLDSAVSKLAAGRRWRAWNRWICVVRVSQNLELMESEAPTKRKQEMLSHAFDTWSAFHLWKQEGEKARRAIATKRSKAQCRAYFEKLDVHRSNVHYKRRITKTAQTKSLYRYIQTWTQVCSVYKEQRLRESFSTQKLLKRRLVLMLSEWQYRTYQARSSRQRLKKLIHKVGVARQRHALLLWSAWWQRARALQRRFTVIRLKHIRWHPLAGLLHWRRVALLRSVHKSYQTLAAIGLEWRRKAKLAVAFSELRRSHDSVVAAKLVKTMAARVASAEDREARSEIAHEWLQRKQQQEISDLTLVCKELKARQALLEIESQASNS